MAVASCLQAHMGASCSDPWDIAVAAAHIEVNFLKPMDPPRRALLWTRGASTRFHFIGGGSGLKSSMNALLIFESSLMIMYCFQATSRVYSLSASLVGC